MQKDVLNEVMHYFNKDNVSVPKELYELVFQAVNKEEQANCKNGELRQAPGPNTKTIYVEQPKIPELNGILFQNITAVSKWLQEAKDNLLQIKKKLNLVGYYEESPQIQEMIQDFEKAMNNLQSNDRHGVSVELDKLFYLSKALVNYSFHLSEHLNFLF